jgi:hypothetical protein
MENQKIIEVLKYNYLRNIFAVFDRLVPASFFRNLAKTHWLEVITREKKKCHNYLYAGLGRDFLALGSFAGSALKNHSEEST